MNAQSNGHESILYGVAITIRPTSVLTFRRLPSAILHISTYPFLPPTTMSGWLRRLFLLQEGIYPETAAKRPNYYVMPPDYHVLGAYPMPRRQYDVHTTKRHGVRAFNHKAFSRLSGGRAKKEVYQLHTWEYLVVEKLRGFVLHVDKERLKGLKALENMGCKCGKEGYAFVEDVSPIKRFTAQQATGDQLDAPATGEELVGIPADLFSVYRYEYAANSRKQLADPALFEKSAIQGFVPAWLGWPYDEAKLTCLSDGEHYIPAGMVEVF